MNVTQLTNELISILQHPETQIVERNFDPVSSFGVKSYLVITPKGYEYDIAFYDKSINFSQKQSTVEDELHIPYTIFSDIQSKAIYSALHTDQRMPVEWMPRLDSFFKFSRSL